MFTLTICDALITSYHRICHVPNHRRYGAHLHPAGAEAVAATIGLATAAAVQACVISNSAEGCAMHLWG